MKRAAIYVRVSTEGQARDGTSLANQEAICREYAEQGGLAIVAIERDDVSGATLIRPGLDELRELVRQRAVDTILVLALDRLSRDTGDMLLLRKEMRDNDVDLVSVTQPLEEGPTGDFFATVLSAVGQLEKSMIADRMRRGKIARAREGKVITSQWVAYGYKFDSEARTLLPHAEHAEIVRTIFRWIGEEGMSLNGCAERLNRECVPTPRGGLFWRESTLHAILHNEAYIGAWHWNKRRGVAPKRPASPFKAQSKGHRRRAKASKVLRPRSEWIEITVPALVTMAQFEQAHAAVERHRILSTRNKKHDYLLSGLLFCRKCGLRMRVRPNRSYHYYICTSRKMTPPSQAHRRCDAPILRGNSVEEAVWGQVMRHLAAPALIRNSVVHSESGASQESARLEAELRRLEKSLEGTKRQMARLLEIYTLGEIERSQFSPQNAELRRQREAIEKGLVEIREEMARSPQWGLRRSDLEIDTMAASVLRDLPKLGHVDRRRLLLDWDVAAITDGETVTVTTAVGTTTTALPRPKRRWRNQFGEGGS